jgi:hypothetical protein
LNSEHKSLWFESNSKHGIICSIESRPGAEHKRSDRMSVRTKLTAPLTSRWLVRLVTEPVPKSKVCCPKKFRWKFFQCPPKEGKTLRSLLNFLRKFLIIFLPFFRPPRTLWTSQVLNKKISTQSEDFFISCFKIESSHY